MKIYLIFALISGGFSSEAQAMKRAREDTKTVIQEDSQISLAIGLATLTDLPPIEAQASLERYILTHSVYEFEKITLPAEQMPAFQNLLNELLVKRIPRIKKAGISVIEKIALCMLQYSFYRGLGDKGLQILKKSAFSLKYFSHEMLTYQMWSLRKKALHEIILHTPVEENIRLIIEELKTSPHEKLIAEFLKVQDATTKEYVSSLLLFFTPTSIPPDLYNTKLSLQNKIVMCAFLQRNPAAASSEALDILHKLPAEIRQYLPQLQSQDTDKPHQDDWPINIL